MNESSYILALYTVLFTLFVVLVKFFLRANFKIHFLKTSMLNSALMTVIDAIPEIDPSILSAEEALQSTWGNLEKTNTITR